MEHLWSSNHTAKWELLLSRLLKLLFVVNGIAGDLRVVKMFVFHTKNRTIMSVGPHYCSITFVNFHYILHKDVGNKRRLIKDATAMYAPSQHNG